MGGNLKIQRKSIQYKTPFLTISDREHCIQRSQWGYEETTEDRQKPQTFKSFLQPKTMKRFIQKNEDRKNFM